MKINVRMFIGDSDIQFQDLDAEAQEKYREKITGIYAAQVSKRVIEMINQGKSEKEIRKYLLLDKEKIAS